MLSLITVLEPLWGSSRDKIQAQVDQHAIKVLIQPYLPISKFKVTGVMHLLSVPNHPRRDTGSLQGPQSEMPQLWQNWTLRQRLS